MINRVLSFIEFFLLYIAGNLFGLSPIVRYLKNPNPQITVRLLRAFGASVGERTLLKGSVIIDNAYEDENSVGNFSYLKIGNNCYIGEGVYFDLSNEVILEDNVIVSGQVSFVTHADCNRSEYLAKQFPRKCSPVRVEKGAWIGFRATILSGVTVRHNAVVAACTLLRKDVESKVLYAGIPGKKIKILDEIPQE
jgi:acetyltransferase-like isoleucine patch superfamily enzyme